MTQDGELTQRRIITQPVFSDIMLKRVSLMSCTCLTLQVTRLFIDDEAIMKRYDTLQMSFDKGQITLICTDMERLNMIVEGVKRKFPFCRVNTFDLLLDWMPYMYIDKLQKHEFEAAWWIVQELSHSGWRPFYLSPVYPSTFSANFEIEIV